MNRVVLNASYCFFFALLFSFKPVMNVIGYLKGNDTKEASHELAMPDPSGRSINFAKHLQLDRLLDTTLNTVICAGDSIEFNGMVLKESGQFFDTLPDINNQDSIITLNLVVADTFFTTINEEICEGDTLMIDSHVITTDTLIIDGFTSVDGCDSTVVINVNQSQVSFSEVDTVICMGDSVFFAGNFFKQDTALNLFTNVAGCDSVVLLKITELDTSSTILNESICPGEVFTYNNQDFSNDTTASFTFMNMNGCDSTVILNLSLRDTFFTEINAVICTGGTFDFEGQTFDSDTTAVFGFTASNNCDSTVVLRLSVRDTFFGEVFDEICEGQTAIFRGDFYTQDTSVTYNLTSTNNCDSVIIYNLTVNDTVLTNVAETICENETIRLGSQFFSTDTVYTETFQTVNGCDSTVVYELTVLDTSFTNVNLSICAGDTVMLGDEPFSADTIHQVIFSNINDCDSVVVYNLDVRDSIITNLDTAICNGGSFEFGGQTIDTAGVFTDVLTAADGCDSTIFMTVMLLDTFRTIINDSICAGDTILINEHQIFSDTLILDSLESISGCDSIIEINVRELMMLSTLLEESVCAGDSILYQGNFLSQDTTISDTLTSISGCDSIITFSLNVLDTFTNRIDTTICAGNFFIVGDSAYTETTIITNQFVTSTSCVTVMVDLTVADTFNITIDSTICQGDTVLLGSTPLTTSGTFSDAFNTIQGCDSLVTVNLTVLDTALTTMDSTICGGDTVFFAMDTLLESGVYTQAFPMENGCDSIVQLNLTVLPAPNIVIDTAICSGDSIMVAGLSLDSTGTYTQMFQTINGCDSIITVNLTVLDTFLTQIDTSLCAGDTINIADLEITTGGTFTQNFQSLGGCDSIVIVNVMELDTFLFNLDFNLCVGDSLVLTDTIVRSAGTYTERLMSSQGCDSTIVYNISILDTVTTILDSTICQGDLVIIGNDTLTESGTFDIVLQSSNGCDSTVTIDLTVLESFLDEQFFTICQGDTLNIRDTTFTESGTYTETFMAQNGCDSIISIVVNVAEIKNEIIDSTICQGDTVVLGRRDLTTSGRFTERLTSFEGCDSVVTINLTVLPSYNFMIDTTICRGDTVFLGDQAITTDGFYSRQLQTVEGCDSIISLNLTVVNSFLIQESATICQGDTFVLGDQRLTTSGVFTQNLMASSGCDSVLEVSLTVLPSFDLQLERTLCQGESFQLGNQALTEPGMYIDTLQTVNGCDSIVSVGITVLPTFSDTFEVTICDNEVFIFNNQFISQPGTYQATFSSMEGCDSSVVINLSTQDIISTRDEVTICDGEVYTFGSRQLTRAGEYTETFTSSIGCDSVVFLTLSLRPKSASGFNATICEGESFNFNGQMITEAGIYQEVLTSVNGCDSIVTLNLRVNPISRTNLEQTICEGETYVFGDRTITEPGMYRDTFIAQNGCFIVLTLDLTIADNFRDTTFATICDGEVFEFGDQNLTQSGIYSQRLTASNGCDSIVVLNLTATENLTDTLDVTICSGDTFNLGRQALTMPGTYIAFLESLGGCDSTVTLNLATQDPIETSQSVTLCNATSFEFGDRTIRFPGTYTNTFSTVNGCDSTVTLELDFQSLDTAFVFNDSTNEVTVNVEDATFTWIDCETDLVVLETTSQSFSAPATGQYRVIINSSGCMDTTDCFIIEQFITSTKALDVSDQFNLFPNPAQNSVTLSTANTQLSGTYQVNIMDLRGKVYRNDRIELRPRQEIEISTLPAGMYVINLFNEDKGIARLRFLKIE